MINIESIKGKIRSMAEKKNLKSQEVLQIYFFERFLERLSKSKYKNNFVIKGGFLISSLIGIENRTTMDMDTTIKGIALKEENIKIMAYPLETILAEKYETIIRRNITTTRMRDFYDLYTLYKLKKDQIDYKVLKEAIERTSDKRGSQEIMKDYEEIIEDIKEDSYQRSLWEVYLSENKYIGDLKFDKVVGVVRIISDRINEM